MPTIAEKIIKPSKAGIFRTVFLYTGQGESTLLVIPTGTNISDYLYVLVDSDRDKEPNEIDLIELFKDLFSVEGKLEIFINTHPHNDHFGGIKEIYDEIGFKEVWHSNHKPGKPHNDAYKNFQYVLGKVGKDNEFHLKGSNSENEVHKENGAEVTKKLGNIDYIILSPAEYLCEEIEDEKEEERNKRIHEQCGVIKFIYGKDAKGILITGDSDKEAWKEHITDYHKDKLPSIVLSASHHGSRTFFKKSEEDEDVYEDHIKEINPTYLIISAPKQVDSPHGHPHDDAMDIYKKHVDEDGIFHLGKTPYSIIVDINENGDVSIETDEELIKAYGNKESEKNDDEDKDFSKSFIVPKSTRLDEKPMGYDTLV